MITFSIGVFFWLSIGYLFLKNQFNLKPFTDIWFLLIVVVLMCTINMTTMSECNNSETAILYTVIPWMFIFLPMLIMLYYFPSWKSPFSNTIGYFCILLNKENVNTLITLLKEQTEDCKSRILASPWILMNQFTSDEFNNLETKKYGGEPRVVNQEGGPVLDSPETTLPPYLSFLSFFSSETPKNIYLEWLKLDDVENVQKFKKTLELKELISTWIWYMLIALITISTSYTLIMNASCIKTKKIVNTVERVDTTSQNATNSIPRSV